MTDTTPDDRSPNEPPEPPTGKTWARFCTGIGILFLAIGLYAEFTSTQVRGNSALMIGFSNFFIGLYNFRRIHFETEIAARDETIRRLRSDLARFTAPAPPKEKFGIPYASPAARPL